MSPAIDGDFPVSLTYDKAFKKWSQTAAWILFQWNFWEFTELQYYDSKVREIAER